MPKQEYSLGWHRGMLCAVWYENGRRKRHSLSTNDKSVASIRLAEFARVHKLQTKGAPVTIAAIYQAYIEGKRAEGKPITRIQDAWKRLAPVFGTLLPSHIDKHASRAYVAARRKEGISAGTVHVELGYLRASLRFAEKEGWITKAPFVELPTKPAPRHHSLSRAEAKRLLEAAAMPHVKLFIRLAIATAGRASALLQLTWDRVDFERRKIILSDPARAETPKGRATVPMNDQIYKALLEAKENSLSSYVIEWAGGPVLSVKKGIAAAAKRAKIKVSPHVLRHTAAVWLAESGIPMDEIAQYLGHDDVRTTRKIYARYSPEHLQDAAKSLEFG